MSVVNYHCTSIFQRKTNVNTIECIASPNKLGHPLLLAIGPTNGDNIEFINLKANGLNNNSSITVVYKVYFHFNAEFSDIVFRCIVYISILFSLLVNHIKSFFVKKSNVHHKNLEYVCTRRGLNSRPQVHKTRALTKLRHTCSHYIYSIYLYIVYLNCIIIRHFLIYTLEYFKPHLSV